MLWTTSFYHLNTGPGHRRVDGRREGFPTSDVTVGFQVFARRLGKGSDFRKWERPPDPFPPFPLGVVERAIGIGASVQWELSGASNLGVEFSRVFVENQDHIAGRDDNSSAFRLAVSLDLQFE
ncbi:MAG: hypothetical protein GTN50_06085 [Candidatus Latescibacteria bacterium]|nr:hypothetical protein [Candidatus Latescibacterota bacterium]